MSAAANSRPIHSQGLILIAVSVGVLMMAVYLTSAIIENENGGISAAVRTIGIGLAIWAAVRPKAGLYILSFEAFTVDYIKKIAVYYGAVSIGTIIEVLIVGMLAVVGTIGGFMLQSVALRRYKLPSTLWAVLAVAAVASAAMMVAQREYGLEKSGENAFNCCVYITIAIPMAMLLVDREEIIKLLNVQFFCATIWAVWGIKQYYFGFTWLEWFYAQTGLSAVATDHMIRVNDTRPFGFGSGMPNYSVLGPYLCYGIWQVFRATRRRFLMLVCTFILLWGVITSLQRTMILYPAFVLLLYFCFQSVRRSVVAFAVGCALFITGVIYAERIAASMGEINDTISVQGYWGESVMSVNTYIDRLGSWVNLKNPAAYSLFGLSEPLPSHDIFTSILNSYGVVGLIATLTTVLYSFWFILRTILRVEDPEDRQLALFCFAMTSTTLALGFINGGSFTANPVNLALWTFFGVAICMVVNSRLVPEPSKNSVRELIKALEAAKAKAPQAPQVPMAARARLIPGDV